MANLLSINRTPLTRNGQAGRWYILDDNSDTVVDSWGNTTLPAYNGSLSWGSAGGPGGVGPVYNATSARPRGGYTDNDLMLGEYDYSISAWIKPTQSYSANRHILTRTDGNTGYTLLLTGSINNVRLHVDSFNFQSPTALDNVFNFSYTFTTNQWYAVTVVVRRTTNYYSNGGYNMAGTTYLYINGSLAGSQSFSVMYSLGGSLSIFNIGTNNSGGERFEGNLRDIAIVKNYTWANNDDYVSMYSSMYD